MPYRIIWEPSLAIVHMYGDTLAIDAIRATQEWQADEKFDQLHHVVYDLSMAQSIETLDDGAVENIVTMSIGASFSNPQIHVVVVLPDNSANPSIKRIVALIGKVYLGDIYPIKILAANVWAGQLGRPQM